MFRFYRNIDFIRYSITYRTLLYNRFEHIRRSSLDLRKSRNVLCVFGSFHTVALISSPHLLIFTFQCLLRLLLKQELDLSRNQLAGFEEDFAVKLLNIDDVKFEQNPFVCDLCHVGPILNRISMVMCKFRLIQDSSLI